MGQEQSLEGAMGEPSVGIGVNTTTPEKRLGEPVELRSLPVGTRSPACLCPRGGRHRDCPEHGYKPEEFAEALAESREQVARKIAGEFPGGLEYDGFQSRFLKQAEEGAFGPDAERLAQIAIAFAVKLLRKQRSYGAQILKRRLLCPREDPADSILSRFSDKIERLIALQSGDAANSVGEEFEDTMLDAGGYALLWLLAKGAE